MTLWATREGKQVTVHAGHGPIKFEITEDAGHLRSFWGQLGREIEEAEKHGKPLLPGPDLLPGPGTLPG
jgi:hypothetical protein